MSMDKVENIKGLLNCSCSNKYAKFKDIIYDSTDEEEMENITSDVVKKPAKPRIIDVQEVRIQLPRLSAKDLDDVIRVARSRRLEESKIDEGLPDDIVEAPEPALELEISCNMSNEAPQVLQDEAIKDCTNRLLKGPGPLAILPPPRHRQIK